jgi:hypothetical protein
MLYREDDVPDWLHKARSIIRLDGETTIGEAEDEEEIAMHKIMSRYDDEDIDNLAYANDDEDDDIDDDDIDDNDDDDDDDDDDDIDDDDVEELDEVLGESAFDDDDDEISEGIEGIDWDDEEDED